MTAFGPDVSSYQHGINVGALADPFVLLKATEGNRYADADYPGWLAQAKAAGKIIIAYHFVRADVSAADQASWIAAHIIDTRLPLMLDVETTGTSTPRLPLVLELADRCIAQGLRPKLAYIPRWYWQQIGSPDLTPLAARGIGLIASAYPNQEIHDPGTVYAADGGDSGPGWKPYGGMTPLLWQFTDVAIEGGMHIGDMNAFRGTREQLAGFLGATTPPPSTSNPATSGGSAVGTIPPSISQKWPELAAEFPPNAAFTDESALIWADGGARAAAMYARQALDAVNALTARIGQPVSIDVAALATALGPLLQTGPSPDEVATAVVAHLAAQMQKD